MVYKNENNHFNLLFLSRGGRKNLRKEALELMKKEGENIESLGASLGETIGETVNNVVN